MEHLELVIKNKKYKKKKHKLIYFFKKKKVNKGINLSTGQLVAIKRVSKSKLILPYAHE